MNKTSAIIQSLGFGLSAVLMIIPLQLKALLYISYDYQSPYKMEKLNILFVCSRNKWRSRTAETIYKNSQAFNVQSAGTEPSAVVKVSVKHVLWEDIIFAMEKKHKQRLKEKFPDETMNKKIIILNIEDNYTYMDEELIEIIKTSVDFYLEDI